MQRPAMIFPERLIQPARRRRQPCNAGPVVLARALILAFALGATTATADEGAALYATCAACHGADAGGNPALGAPALAGQLEVYLKRQLQMFRRGIRGGPGSDGYAAQMQLFATQLADDAAVATLAAWLAALPPVVAPVAAAPTGDVRRGGNLYSGNCGACHGGRGEGNEALKAPRLAGLDDAYLRRQFEHFLSGARGSDPRDRLGRQMATMAAALPDIDALDDILAYVATLPGAAAPATVD